MALIIFANTCNLKVLSHDRQCHGPDLFEYFRPFMAAHLGSANHDVLAEVAEHANGVELDKIHFSGNPHSSKALRIGSFDNLLVSGNYSKERLTWQAVLDTEGIYQAALSLTAGAVR